MGVKKYSSTNVISDIICERDNKIHNVVPYGHLRAVLLYIYIPYLHDLTHPQINTAGHPVLFN